MHTAQHKPEHLTVVAGNVNHAEANRDINVWIDCYDDIFSDFDLRDYTVRNVSDDFLREIKKVSHEYELEIDALKLFIPGRERKEATEAIIARRLHAHFTKNHSYYLKKKKREWRKNLLMTAIGISMMTGAGFISTEKSHNFFLHLLKAVLEPGGWFLVWVGMENVINNSRKEKPELDFYTKMQKSKINFLDK